MTLTFLSLLVSLSFLQEPEPLQEPESLSTMEIKTITVLTLDGTINPATSLYFERGIKKADGLVIIQLNTPGGLLSSTRDIVQSFLESDTPIVVYVAPSGGQAASAGMFITMAAHLAAMAPATNIGAASPVHLNQSEESEESENSKTLARKAMHDTAAFARSIAVERGRNAEWAEQAVREAVSLTAEEALDNQVIDMIAVDLEDLINQLQGKRIEAKGQSFQLNLEDAVVDQKDMGLKETFLDLISNPNIAYILMILGFYGIYFELSNPGSLFPGIVGGICLILGFFAMQTLPLNVAGIALLLLGLVLFALETQIPSGGMLSVGAIISFTLGSFMLFEPEASFPALRVSFYVIIPVVILTTLFFIFAVGFTLKAARRRTDTGQEGMVGMRGIVCSRLQPNGQVEIHGEIWKACTHHPPLEVQSEVVVDSVKNLTLWVSPGASPGVSPIQTEQGEN